MTFDVNDQTERISKKSRLKLIDNQTYFFLQKLIAASSGVCLMTEILLTHTLFWYYTLLVKYRKV